MDEKEAKAGATPSSGDTGTSLEQQIKAAELKGKSDALADVNRTLAESAKARKAAEAAEQRVTQMLKDYEETIRDEPDKLNEFRGKQAKTKADADLAGVRQELDEAKQRLSQVDNEKAETIKQQKAREIAGRLNVDAGNLIKLAKFTDGTPEAIEDIAKSLPKIVPENPLSPDSNRGSGSSASEQRIRDAFIANPENPQVKADYLALRRRKGI